jgi:hypothetical protein
MPQDTKQSPTPNDQRSTVKNPNSDAYQSDQDNRSRQLNSQDPLNANDPGRKAPGGSSNQQK